MSKQHTPGPWNYTDGCVLDTTGERVRVDGVSLPCGYVPRDDQSRDNARLIAAAPELLEACRKFLETWRRAGPLGSAQFEKFDTAVRMAEEAVAKAVGG